MKTIKLIVHITLSVSVLIITSCKKEEEAQAEYPTALDYVKDITGTYLGYYEQVEGLKNSDTAYCDVSHMGGLLVEIHCYGELLDTTFMMNIYANHDSMMLCATGETFEHMYGHELDGSHMNMNHHGSSSTTEWGHHMEDEHDSGDIQHYGGFSINSHTMDYTFRIEDENSVQYIRFYGTRLNQK
jgi:hypothetical protein